ncbi:MAG: carboxypeptidase-like regulatory domain-containing protein [Candidatus Acidiferrum sp.]
MRSPRWIVLVAMGAILGIVAPAFSLQQETPPPPQAPQAAPTPESSSSEKPKKQKYSHANDFLILGTVFDPKGYAFPGVQLKIRRSAEKKFRWDDYTNSRGEFAIRVPQGSEYEVLVRVKGFADQTRELNAQTGLGETRIVFRMEPGGKKK